jgi:surface polysaccharide O-acyltransferase-like enzyme
MRMQGIDVFRVLIQYFIVWSHLFWFGNLPRGRFNWLARTLITTGTRCAIPFFLIVAGYFLEAKRLTDPGAFPERCKQYIRRLVIVFLFWSAVYALIDPRAFIALARTQPDRLVMEGSSDHLWFLVSLILTVWLSMAKPFLQDRRRLLVVGILLYGIGLLAGSYKDTCLGFDLHISTRDGVFFSTLFFAVGALWRARMPKLGLWGAILLSLAGYALSWGEALFLLRHHGLAPGDHDYLLGTVPFGLGVTLLAFRLRVKVPEFITTVGNRVLGIYVSHLLFVILLAPLGRFVNPTLWLFVFPLLAFSCSLGLTAILWPTRLRAVIA